jgi:hypothetical protein
VRDRLAERADREPWKTFLLEAHGPASGRTWCKVAWFSLEDLGVLLRRHQADDPVTKAVDRVLRADLVIIDDIGLLRLPRLPPMPPMPPMPPTRNARLRPA